MISRIAADRIGKVTNFCWKCAANRVARIGQKCNDCRIRDRIKQPRSDRHATAEDYEAALGHPNNYR